MHSYCLHMYKRVWVCGCVCVYGFRSSKCSVIHDDACTRVRTDTYPPVGLLARADTHAHMCACVVCMCSVYVGTNEQACMHTCMYVKMLATSKVSSQLLVLWLYPCCSCNIASCETVAILYLRPCFYLPAVVLVGGCGLNR